METSYEIIKTEYIWGICESHPEAVVAVAVAITVAITLNIGFKLVVLFKNKKEKK